MKHTSRAFTLIEMAVVLVIIGLIIGGIVAGQGMYKSALLKSITTEAMEFKTAINQFRTKYKYWPGDLPDANLLQGSFATTNVGDGNDWIGGGAVAGAGEMELYYVWQHLVAAKMINGSFTTAGTEHATYTFTPSVNVPESRYDRGAWNISTVNTGAVRPLYSNNFPVGYNIRLASADWRPTTHLMISKGTDSEAPDAILLPQEAEDIDMKFDDGKPGQGKLQANHAGSLLCGTTAVAATALYDVDTSTRECFLMFMHVTE